jgi:peptidoglycan hydrolase-like protein with peptidoglycan-binding domain
MPPSVDSKIVLKIQERLKLLGLYKGAVDGVFGSSTALAIDLFKVKNGTPIGEYFDRVTLRSLGVIED